MLLWKGIWLHRFSLCLFRLQNVTAPAEPARAEDPSPAPHVTPTSFCPILAPAALPASQGTISMTTTLVSVSFKKWTFSPFLLFWSRWRKQGFFASIFSPGNLYFWKRKKMNLQSIWMPLADYNSDMGLIGSAGLGISSASASCVILGQSFNLSVL